jgi:hypothetical protein
VTLACVVARLVDMPMTAVQRREVLAEVDAKEAEWVAAATGLTTRTLVLKIQADWGQIRQVRATYLAEAQVLAATLQTLYECLAADDAERAALGHT